MRRRRLGTTLAAGAAGLLAMATLSAGVAAHATTSTQSSDLCSSGPSRVGRFGGIEHARSVQTGCPAHNTSDAAIGTPPLLYHGGPAMGTSATGPVVVTPIFWSPGGTHTIPASYRSLITRYLGDVAHDSGTHTNVFSTLPEYFGSNGGQIHYAVSQGTPILDTGALPPSGCTVAQTDRTKIYVDGSGYDACIDDAQVIAETDRVVAAQGLPKNFAHLYVMFLPKHVESCFAPGSTTSGHNGCTINHHRSTAFCAYHSQAPSGTIYANMPFPIYQSDTRFTCGTDKSFATLQSPNGNPDADVEISPTSHEIMEAITDPDVSTGWYDSSGFENGDECAYVFGPTAGSPGGLYNQTINGNHYLTQEEFSNADFIATQHGCLQGE